MANNKLNINLVAFLAPLATAMVCQTAQAFPWPVVEVFEMTESSYDRTTRTLSGKYNLKFGIIDIPDIYADELIPHDVMAIGGLSGIGYDAYGWYTTGAVIATPNATLCNNAGGCYNKYTWKQLSEHYFSTYGNSYEVVNAPFSFTNPTNGYSERTLLRVCSGVRFWDGGYTGPVNPPDYTRNCIHAPQSGYINCSFTHNTLDFQFGPVAANRANGIKKTQHLEFACINNSTSDFSYSLYTPSGDKIFLSNGMYATLSIEEKSIIEYRGKIEKGTSSKSLPLTAMLEGSPSSTGPFEGNTVLKIMIN